MGSDAYIIATPRCRVVELMEDARTDTREAS